MSNPPPSPRRPATALRACRRRLQAATGIYRDQEVPPTPPNASEPTVGTRRSLLHHRRPRGAGATGRWPGGGSAGRNRPQRPHVGGASRRRPVSIGTRRSLLHHPTHRDQRSGPGGPSYTAAETVGRAPSPAASRLHIHMVRPTLVSRKRFRLRKGFP